MKDIGLALGGGAVLGAAHIGALRAIDEFDITVNYVAGTSIGAFVAAFFAFGRNWKEIEKIASELKWIDITGISLSKYGLLSNEKLGELMTKHIGDKNIQDSDIPLAMIATDVTNGEKVILDKGSVADAVMASTCLPGIFKPIEKNGRMLVDGGIVENIPIKTVKGMGADYVIGIDLMTKHTYKKQKNILDVIMNSFHFLLKQSVVTQSEDADLLIKPNLEAYRVSDMSQIIELMGKGYEESKKALKNIF